MATINMHMKFEIEILKQTWLMLRKPCRLQTDGQTDRRTDGRTRWIQYTPPPTSLGGGITMFLYYILCDNIDGSMTKIEEIELHVHQGFL